MSREYLREFTKKFEMAVIVYSDSWGKLIHEKNQKSKISCPFNIHKLSLSCSLCSPVDGNSGRMERVGVSFSKPSDQRELKQ